MTINADNIKFYSEKQWEEYDILTKLEGFVLDHQTPRGSIVLVYFAELENHGIYVADEVYILSDGTVIHV